METQKLYNALLIIISTVVGLLLVEVTLRVFSQDEYYVWPPNLRKTFQPLPGVMPGISGPSRFFINKSGIRGEPFSGYERYRILTVGGSTTECLYLDQEEAWPYLVQGILNRELGQPLVWVGNVGKSGHNTRHHILQVEKLLDSHPGIDLVVLLIGINDLHLRLSKDIDYQPLSEQGPEYHLELLRQAFSVYPDWEDESAYSFFERSKIWRTLRKVKKSFFGTRDDPLLQQDEAGHIYVKWRQHRQNAAHIRETLPDLSVAVNEYATNTHTLIDLAEKRGVRIVLMTQPSIWRPDLSKELVELLWLGGIGDFQAESSREYYSVAALADALEMYNRALRQVCKEREVECIDLASVLPKDETVFFDDIHFNESGAKKVASLVAQYLVDTGLLESSDIVSDP